MLEPFNEMTRIKPTSASIGATFSATSHQIMKLEWNPLLDYSESPPTEFPRVDYSVFYTTDMAANLESSCMLNSDVQASMEGVSQITSQGLTKDIGLKPGKTYKINVVAVIKAGLDEGTIFPYEQFTVTVPDPNQESVPFYARAPSGSNDESNHVMFVASFVILAVVVGIFLQCVGKKNRSRAQILSKLTFGWYRPSRGAPATRQEQMQHELGMYGQVTNRSSPSIETDYNPPTTYENGENE